MSPLTMKNPVFVVYAVAAALMVLKLMGHGWATVAMMTRTKAGLLNPEDLRAGPANPRPRPKPRDERSRRLLRGDLESIPAFLAIGLVFAAIAPPSRAAYLLLALFVLPRFDRTWAYATARSHETRATFSRSALSSSC